MQLEEVIAKNSLAQLSQATHYLVDWTEDRLIKKLEPSTTPQPQTKALRGRKDDRYDLRKWEVRMQSLNNVEYPIMENLTEKASLSTRNKALPLVYRLEQKRHSDVEGQVNRLLAEQLVQRKLESFRRRVQQLQKNIYQQHTNYRPSQLPINFHIKKRSKLPSRPQESSKDLGSYRSQLQIQRRKYSMPMLQRLGVRGEHCSEKAF